MGVMAGLEICVVGGGEVFHATMSTSKISTKLFQPTGFSNLKPRVHAFSVRMPNHRLRRHGVKSTMPRLHPHRCESMTSEIGDPSDRARHRSSVRAAGGLG
jgi:hypothetical protein